MARRVEWSEAATADLLEIVQQLERDSPEALGKFIEKVMRSVEILETFPEAGTLLPRYARRNVREKLAGVYRLVYWIRSDGIFVLGLIHSARDFWPAWRSRPERFPGGS